MKDSDWNILYELHKNPNMTKVAALLYTTQPALTKRIHAMEEEFQVKILLRTPKGLSFTPEGDCLAERAGMYLQFMEETRQELSALRTSKQTVITIGSSYTFSKYTLTDLLLKYRNQQPQVTFQVINEPSNLLFRRVLDGTVDVGFVRGDYEGAVYQKRIAQNQAFLVTRELIDLDNLPSMQRIGYSTNEQTRHLFADWWQDRFGTDIPKEMSVGYIDFAWQVIHRGDGYTCCFLPHGFENELHLVLTPMTYRDGTPVTRNTWFVYPRSKQLDNELLDFIYFIEKEMDDERRDER
ncbi:MAG: LysR family transcriptional regulator [Lachnospiraceae bacterium]|nr:LysR family transcriptional regulator [Lachnospiraceae bacterium]